MSNPFISQNWYQWLFIAIGFVGAIFLTIAAILNVIKVRKNHNFNHIVLKVQVSFFIANLMYFAYALGMSIATIPNGAFFNSIPTWVGNFIPLVLNGYLILGKLLEDIRNKKKHKE